MGWLAGALAVCGVANAQLPPAATVKIEFARDIEPLLSKRCLVCHGAQQQMSGFRLDQKDAALKGGASGIDIVPGNSAESRLIASGGGAGQESDAAGGRTAHRRGDRPAARMDRSGRDWPARKGAALVVPEDSADAAARRARSRMGAQCDRHVHSGAPGEGRHRAFARSAAS